MKQVVLSWVLTSRSSHNLPIGKEYVRHQDENKLAHFSNKGFPLRCWNAGGEQLHASMDCGTNI